MQTKIRVEYANRADDKYNIWVKRDVIYGDERPPELGTWGIVQVCPTREEAIEAWRAWRARLGR